MSTFDIEMNRVLTTLHPSQKKKTTSNKVWDIYPGDQSDWQLSLQESEAKSQARIAFQGLCAFVISLTKAFLVD